MIGEAHITASLSRLKSHLNFSGKVGGTDVSGTLPLPSGHGQSNSSTGTIVVG